MVSLTHPSPTYDRMLSRYVRLSTPPKPPTQTHRLRVVRRFLRVTGLRVAGFLRVVRRLVAVAVVVPPYVFFFFLTIPGGSLLLSRSVGLGSFTDLHSVAIGIRRGVHLELTLCSCFASCAKLYPLLLLFTGFQPVLGFRYGHRAVLHLTGLLQDPFCHFDGAS